MKYKYIVNIYLYNTGEKQNVGNTKPKNLLIFSFRSYSNMEKKMNCEWLDVELALSLKIIN